MKKLWYLFLTLFLAFGLVACEKEGDIAPDPEPEPVGPTAAPKGVVSDVAFVRDGYQAAELSWTDPKEEFPITGYQIVAKCEGQKNLTYSIEADDIVVVDGKQTYVIEGLEQPEYEVTILVANAFGQQKNGTVFKGVKPFTLESMTMPTVTIVDVDDAKYLRFTNVNGSRNIFDHLTLTMKDAEGNVIFEGEAAADEDALAAALEDKTVANDAVDVLIELAEGVTLDDKATYSVDYTIYAHAAIGGVIEDGAYVYEEVLDMLDEPASVEATAEDLGVGVEVQPLYFHFYSYGSKYLKELEQAVITVPQVFVPVSEGSTQKEPKYAYYKIYTGTGENDYELYTKHVEDGVYPPTKDDGGIWFEPEQIDAHGISELVPSVKGEGESKDYSTCLYADVWAGQAINTIDLEHKEYPSYVRVEAYDKYGRMVAMGQRLCPTFSVRADQPDIQAHQPKWELLPNNDGVSFTLKASHLSAARGYARKVEWWIKDEAGQTVAEDMVDGGSSSNQVPTLITKEWKVDAKNFIVGKKYTVDYKIDYIPTYVIPGMDDQQPLDYDPETGKFTPTPDGVVENATGLDHDVRILRDYLRDEQGNVKYRIDGTDEEGNRIYAFKHESGKYKCFVAWMEKSAVLTSEELIEAGATLENELTVPEENGEAAPYQIELTVSVPKKMNTVNLSWNALAAEEITKVVISDGSEDIVVTEGGEYAWSVSDGRASFELEGVTGGPDVFVKAQVYAGEELLDEDEIGASIFTLDNWQAPVFEWVLLEDGRYKFVAKNLANVNYAFSHNIYEDVANSEKKQSVVRLYDSNNQLVQTLYATSIRDWHTHLWSCYARWELSMQDAWDEWVWVGNHDSKGQNQREVPASAIPAGEYRVEYEMGYVVNKNGFWSTTDASHPTEVDSRPDNTIKGQEHACVAFPPQVQGAYTNDNRSENVLYCENRLQLDPDNDGNFDSNYQKQQLVKVFVKTGEATFNVSASTNPQIFPSAFIDSSTVYIRQESGNGQKSVDGLFESVKLTWSTINCEPTKFVIAYDDQTVDVEGSATEKVIEGLKTPSVEFTVTAYEGEEAVASKTITSDVYTTATMEQVRFNTVYNPDGHNWKVYVENGLSGKEWAFATLKFNFYEATDTNFENPLFHGDVTKDLLHNQNPSTVTLWSSFGYATYKDVNNSDYDAVTEEYTKSTGTFTGIKHSTDYVVKYELTVLPMIYSRTDDTGKFYHKKMLYDAPQTVTGTYAMATTEAAPADLAPIATAEGYYQGAKIQWNAAAGATGYQVLVGGGKVVAEVGADATSAEVTGLTDARKYVFTVKALGTNATAQTAETEIYTLCDYAPEFEIVKQEDGSWKLNMYKLAYEGGIFRSIAFTIKEKGSDTVLYSENGTSGETGFIPDGSHFGWANHFYTPWRKQTDSAWSTAEGKKLAGVQFKHNTTYVVEYTAALTPGMVALNLDEYAGPDSYFDFALYEAGTHVYYKSLLRRDNDIPTTTGTMEYTTEIDLTALLVKAAIYDNLTPIQYGEKKGQMAVGGIYQGAKLSWNSAGASYDVYYKESTAAEFTKAANVTETNYTFAEGTLPARKYDFKVVALDASNIEISSGEASTDIYTMTGAAVTFKALEQADGTWKIYSYGVSGENYCFNQFEFSIYEEGGSTAVVTDSKNKGNDNVNNAFNIWPGTRSVATYREITNSDYDDHSHTEPWAANTFDKSKKYVVKYTLKARPQIFTEWKVVNATDAGYGFSSMLWELRTLGEQTAELEIVPAQ